MAVAATLIVVITIVVLAGAQLLLPGLATRSLRDRLAKHGEVRYVSISAFPAIELLWHRASSATIRLRSYRNSSEGLSNLLGGISGVGSLDVSVGTLTGGALTLRKVRLIKRGERIRGSAELLYRDLREAVPLLRSVRAVHSADGEVVLRGKASLFGINTTIDATLRAEHGRVVVAPDVPLGSVAAVTVFSAPAFYVEAVKASRIPGGLELSAKGVPR